LREELSVKYPAARFEMIPSSGGVFEVSIDEKLVFSKKQLGRFPRSEEIK